MPGQERFHFRCAERRARDDRTEGMTDETDSLEALPELFCTDKAEQFSCEIVAECLEGSGRGEVFVRRRHEEPRALFVRKQQRHLFTIKRKG